VVNLADQSMRVVWVPLACFGLAVSAFLDFWLLFGAKLTVLMVYLLIVYGWPVLMLVLATRVGSWLSPPFLLVGLLPLLITPLLSLDPIPWLGALAYFAALLIAISEGLELIADRWHARRSH
jgi:hypothetical protein